MQVDPIKPTLTPPEIKRLKAKYDKLLSNIALKFNLRRYIMEIEKLETSGDVACLHIGRGLHSSTFQLNLSRF